MNPNGSATAEHHPSPPSAGPVPPEGHLPAAVLSAGVGVVLIAGCYLGSVGLLVVLALVQAGLVVSWVFATALPGRIGALVLGAAAAGAADALVSRWPSAGYGPVVGVLGLAVPAMFVHQLTRGVVRNRVLESMADIALLVVGVVCLAGLVLLRHRSAGDSLTAAAIAAVTGAPAVSLLLDSVWNRPRFDDGVARGLPGVAAGAAAAGLLALPWLRRLIDFTGARGFYAGAAVGLLSCLISVGVSFAGAHSGLASRGRRPAVRRLWPAAAVLLTTALATPAAYLVLGALSG